MIKPGIQAAEVHNAVCDIFEAHGYDTYRSGSKVGFIHSTGHGVGLDVHELPSVGENGVLLEVGNVITIEPGLYYPEVGGIRSKIWSWSLKTDVRTSQDWKRDLYYNRYNLRGLLYFNYIP